MPTTLPRAPHTPDFQTFWRPCSDTIRRLPEQQTYAHNENFIKSSFASHTP